MTRAGIRTHLFVISPNNSGSTVLRNTIAASTGCWQLPREGQHIPGFVGPSTRGTDTRLIWAATPDRLSLFTDPSAYDWSKSQSAWQMQATADGEASSVMVLSSPPFLFNVEALAAAFPDARFVFLVRNPFAAIEGILRRADQQTLRPGEEITDLAARHILACFDRQRSNVANFTARGIPLTYENLCADPAATAARIVDLAPDLHGLDLTTPVSVKGLYREPLRNMNPAQLAALTPDQIEIIERIFAPAHEVLESFGYRSSLS